ncbi:MAG: hydroxymethylglutaryl-CoA lyase [Chloroflexota bacterium]|nr:MAG: hydroxymethylglutaryl-CoA lyase [Chloroflexota bacterium]
MTSETVNNRSDNTGDLPKTVSIVEVGPRDGLQREPTPISTDDKVSLIEGLVAPGLKRIQVTSFVHPKYVPQMADAEEVCRRLPEKSDVVYSGLALNLKGVERAHAAGLAQVDISVSASDAHSRRNANRSIEEALAEFKEMYDLAREHGIVVRGGIQCAFGYQKADDVHSETVISLARHHLDLGVDELVLADSSGFANPSKMTSLLKRVISLAKPTPVVLHLHDTRGMGLANVLAGLQCGVSAFDTAFGGLGGCPFIDGATGNIATEDTVYMLEEMGIQTGVNLRRLSRISRHYEQKLGQALPGKLYQLMA